MGREAPDPLHACQVASARALANWLADRPPSTRTARLVRLAVRAASTLLAIVAVYAVARPVLRAHAPPDIPPDGPDGVRYGLPEAVRRDIFRELASGEPTARTRAAQTFPGDPWSMEDHRASFERDAARAIALRRDISLSQVYLTLDEGIREHWHGPDGKALSPFSTPLAPRKR